MRLNVAGFVDVGFVRAAVAAACGVDASRVRLDAAQLVKAVEEVAAAWTGLVLRVYWYDGQHPADHARHAPQRKYLDAVAATPGIQLRLGHIVTRTPAWHSQLQQALTTCGVDRDQFARHFTFAPEYQQKGVDTLMVLDIVRLAQRHAYDVAVVFSGDRDIAEAVRAAQDEGRRVTLIVPDDRSVAAELRALADEVIVFDTEMLRSLNRAATTSAPSKKSTTPQRPADHVESPTHVESPAPVEPSTETLPELVPTAKAPTPETKQAEVAAPAAPVTPSNQSGGEDPQPSSQGSETTPSEKQSASSTGPSTDASSAIPARVETRDPAEVGSAGVGLSSAEAEAEPTPDQNVDPGPVVTALPAILVSAPAFATAAPSPVEETSQPAPAAPAPAAPAVSDVPTSTGESGGTGEGGGIANALFGDDPAAPVSPDQAPDATSAVTPSMVGEVFGDDDTSGASMADTLFGDDVAEPSVADALFGEDTTPAASSMAGGVFGDDTAGTDGPAESGAWAGGLHIPGQPSVFGSSDRSL